MAHESCPMRLVYDLPFLVRRTCTCKYVSLYDIHMYRVYDVHMYMYLFHVTIETKTCKPITNISA